MSTDDIKSLVQGGFAAALLYLLYLVGMRIVAALDRVSAKQDESNEAIARVEAKIDAWMGRPAEAEQPVRRNRTPPQGVGIYSMQRPEALKR